MTTRTGPRAEFASAAESFATLVRRIPDGRWDDPGLGDWDVRSLVGHASRSLITVSTYLRNAAQREDARAVTTAIHRMLIIDACLPGVSGQPGST